MLKQLFQVLLTAGPILFATQSYAQSESPYIIVADEMGNLPTDADGNYTLITMNAVAVGDETHYTASNVDVPSGMFAIYAKDASGGNDTFYQLTPWAVTPIVCGDAFPNPVSIVMAKNAIIELPEAGTYNFDFFDRKVLGTGYHQIAATNVSKTIYPKQLYLISGSTTITLPEISGEPGCYYALAELPASFQLSYETQLYEMYSFGPVDANETTLEAGQQCKIAHGVNFSSKFTAGATAKSASNMSDIYVRLNPESDMFIQLALPGMTGIHSATATVDDAETEYYTLSGICLGASRPTASGVYIVRNGTSVTKTIIR
ncbi:MAG: hypothetical protein JFR41_09360 [Muribaculaceae bacterium]|nr:hypothetical protein [Muribaculaceae bacterium]